MTAQFRPARRRDLRPALDALENRALLNGAPMHHRIEVHATAFDRAEISRRSLPPPPPRGLSITYLNQAGGYRFINFNGPSPGDTAGTGTNMNGIANNGVAVGNTISNTLSFLNFGTNPLRSSFAGPVNVNGNPAALAFGINAKGVVVGTDGNGNAFFEHRGHPLVPFVPLGGTAAAAFGINDQNAIVGQVVEANTTPGFLRTYGGKSTLTINAPSGPDTVNAQGINNHGLIVGFYVGTDGQDHGFTAQASSAVNGVITGTAVADPVIPNVPGEPGATFVFSQILGVNDKGIAVGYYGDSTTSQHGFLYNTHTGVYTFLDNPSAAFNNGVEVTQITGITNSGEITGFYSDANGVFHGFVAVPHVVK